MIRFKVVGRRDEPIQVPTPSTVPGMPSTAQWTTVPCLIVVSVDDEGKTLTHSGGVPAGGNPLIYIPVAAFDGLAEYANDQTYALVPVE